MKQGGTIGIIAPSSFPPQVPFEEGVAFLKKEGFNVKIHPQVESRHGQFSGTDEEKTEALHAFFKDPSIDAIFTACGGNGAIHLLDKLDYPLIKAHPKILMGFSDATALLNTITARTGLVTFHGPSMSSFSKIKPEDRQSVVALLKGEKDSYNFSAARILRKGNDSGEGVLTGGNLSVLQALTGTAYAPDMHGALLFIEDTSDHLSRYDRMLGHMRLAGWFEHLSGILTGDFLNTQDNPERPFGFSIEERVLEHTKAMDIPVLSNVPIGHGEHLTALPVGCKARLEGQSLTLLEKAVA